MRVDEQVEGCRDRRERDDRAGKAPGADQRERPEEGDADGRERSSGG